MNPNGRPLTPGTDLVRDSRRVMWILTEAERVRREARHAEPGWFARAVAVLFPGLVGERRLV